MLAFILITSVLVMVTCILPQGLFGMLCSARAVRNPRLPYHTDETGFPLYS